MSVYWKSMCRLKFFELREYNMSKSRSENNTCVKCFQAIKVYYFSTEFYKVHV